LERVEVVRSGPILPLLKHLDQQVALQVFQRMKQLVVERVQDIRQLRILQTVDLWSL
jgi:hypothetical protein